MSDQDRPDTVTRLIRLGGARPTVSVARASRVRALAYAEWRRVVSARRKRTATLIGAVALAASLLLIVRFVPYRQATDPPRARPVIVATLGSIVGTATLDDGTPLVAGAALMEGQGFRTSIGSLAALDLARGSSLRLDEDTHVRFMNPTSVAVDRGAVYLDSGAGSAPSVIEVQTSLGVVRDIGTQFEVRVIRGSLRVRVREGEVVLVRGAASTRAAQGTEISVRGDAVTSRTVAVFGPEWAWVARSAPRFDLAGKTLSEFLSWFARESGYTVTFEDDSAARATEVTLQGSVYGMSSEEALEAVIPATGFEAHVIDGRVVIRRQ